MHNRVGFNRLSRKAAHRNAMIRNMITSLFRYEKITTTKAKALEARKAAEKMITRAKIDSVHNRRIINKDIKDAEVLNKLFTEIGTAYKDRPGGYTRIIKKGLRQGDAAELVILELVKDEAKEKDKAVKKKKQAQKKDVKVEQASAKKEDKVKSSNETKDETIVEENVDSKKIEEENIKTEEEKGNNKEETKDEIKAEEKTE